MEFVLQPDARHYVPIVGGGRYRKDAKEFREKWRKDTGQIPPPAREPRFFGVYHAIAPFFTGVAAAYVGIGALGLVSYLLK